MLFALRLFLMLWLLAAGGPAQSAREATISDIRTYAAEDAAAGKPMDEGPALKAFRDNPAGIRPAEIRNIYREAYLAGRPWWKRVPPWVSLLLAALALLFRPLKAWF